MPIYEYMCEKCGAAFEKLLRRTDSPPPACPTCGAKRVKKQFSSFSAAVSAGKAESCSMGSCPSGSCAGGGCPMERD
jgi:putative FmdB family regulatory protein